MKLNILSDLHLSLGALERPENDADVIILAGDIARPREAIAWASGFAKPVLYVPGNHEFYGGSIVDTVAELRRACSGTNVRVLAGDQVTMGGVRFLGTTLWTDFMLFGTGGKRAAAIRDATHSMRDFSRIRTGDAAETLFTPDDSAALFKVQAEWLDNELAEPFAGPTVVITHHAPSRQSIHPRFAESLLNPCFVSDADRLMGRNRARLWIHGHTHDSFDYLCNGTRVLCNPRGYVQHGINENPLFDPNLLVDVNVEGVPADAPGSR
ncbi:MAG: metallophosphoesterase [Betaproteobacteria bacterium]